MRIHVSAALFPRGLHRVSNTTKFDTMMLPSFRPKAVASQVRALVYKDILAIVVRRPIAFALVTYLLPLGFLALILSIPYFVTNNNEYGVSDPGALPSLASTITDKQLILVRPANLGPDVDDVIRKISEPLPADKVRILQTEQELLSVCVANNRGLSSCHASVSFLDTPLTVGAGRNHTWNYTMRGDPARQGSAFHIGKHDSDQETRYLPLQMAIENAMTGLNEHPKIAAFTTTTADYQAVRARKERTTMISEVFTFALFASFFFMISHVSTTVTKQRESGMSHLVDAMGGSATTRVLGTLTAFNLLYLPMWIIFGVLHWRLMFPTTSAGVSILWQILLGLAVNSSTVFAAAFFTKARVSSIYILGAFFILSVATQINNYSGNGAIVALSVLFPSANHFTFIYVTAVFELAEKPLDFNEYSSFRPSGTYPINAATLLGSLAAQIIIYAFLAVAVEHFMHGIDFKHRTFAESEDESSLVVVETYGLKKTFAPTWAEKIFCCGTRKSVVAVDGVSLRGHKGQILCLVGPNGSGKTTTLQMMAGLVHPTEGSVTLNASPSQLGICPQKNTFWDSLTVKEHLYLWSRIKNGREDDVALERLIESCDLVAKANSRASTLSGGQKRKLQLACMFVGGSTVCLIDECTSGLDPLSRRAIWDMLMEQRAKRSIILTTHFLDEVEVLADHIVILTKGTIKCQGPTTELKNLHGGGYRVLVPRSAPALDVPYVATIHQDQRVYMVPDSAAAATLASQLDAAGVSGISLAGPQVEDIFLRVADDPELTALATSPAQGGMDLTPGEITSFWAQVSALLWKRLRVLKRFWWPYLYVLLLPLLTTPFLARELLQKFEHPSCELVAPRVGREFPWTINFYKSVSYTSDRILLGGPPVASEELFGVVKRNATVARYFNISLFDDATYKVDTVDKYMGMLRSNQSDFSFGLYIDPATDNNIVSFPADAGVYSAAGALNLFNQARAGFEIVMAFGSFATLSAVSYLNHPPIPSPCIPSFERGPEY